MQKYKIREFKQLVVKRVLFSCEEQQLLFTSQWSPVSRESEEAQVPVNKPHFDQ